MEIFDNCGTKLTDQGQNGFFVYVLFEIALPQTVKVLYNKKNKFKFFQVDIIFCIFLSSYIMPKTH